MSLAKSCLNCRETIYTKKKYKCCSRQQYICSHCRIKKCDVCKNAPLKKPEDQLKKQLILQKCFLCSQEIQPQKAIFKETSCNIVLCYPCLYETNNKSCEKNPFGLSQSGELSLDKIKLPCGCSYLQKQMVSFLKNICYGCQQPVKQPIYLMKNNACINQQCFSKLQRFGKNHEASEKEMLAIYKIEELLTKCIVCRQKLSSNEFSVDTLSFCSHCTIRTKGASQELQSEEKMLKPDVKEDDKKSIKEIVERFRKLRKQKRSQQKKDESGSIPNLPCASCNEMLKSHELKGAVYQTCSLKTTGQSAARAKNKCSICKGQKERMKKGICNDCNGAVRSRIFDV